MNRRCAMGSGPGLLLLAMLSGVGCGSSSPGGSSGASGSASGSSAATGSSGGSVNSGSATGSATSGSSNGGSTTGGSSSSGGGSSTGGADAGPTCLDASSFASAFTIADTAFCAVEIFTADEAVPLGLAPSWGSHHGPLVVTADTADGGVTFERWSVQPGTSALAKQSTHVPGVLPDGAYLGAEANDLPFFGWTSFLWTAQAPSTAGAIVFIDNGAVVGTYTVNAPYSVAGISDGQGEGRLLFAALSPLGSPATATTGLYEADACSSPVRELGSGSDCSASALVSSWDDDVGPLVVDKAGNAFAVFSAFTSSNQQARGFLAANVTRGQGATAGVPLFTLPGFSGSLAAITPTATTAGLLVFQPFDSTSFDALDVVEQQYTAGADIAAVGTPTPLLHVPGGTSSGLSLMTDDSDRLWVAFTGASSTTYVVLARVP